MKSKRWNPQERSVVRWLGRQFQGGCRRIVLQVQPVVLDGLGDVVERRGCGRAGRRQAEAVHHEGAARHPRLLQALAEEEDLLDAHRRRAGDQDERHLGRTERRLDHGRAALELVFIGNLRVAARVLQRAAERNELHRVILGTDLPGGTGVVPSS